MSEHGLLPTAICVLSCSQSQVFQEIDTSGDGILQLEEFVAGIEKVHALVHFGKFSAAWTGCIAALVRFTWFVCLWNLCARSTRPAVLHQLLNAVPASYISLCILLAAASDKVQLSWQLMVRAWTHFRLCIAPFLIDSDEFLLVRGARLYGAVVKANHKEPQLRKQHHQHHGVLR